MVIYLAIEMVPKAVEHSCHCRLSPMSERCSAFWRLNRIRSDDLNDWIWKHGRVRSNCIVNFLEQITHPTFVRTNMSEYLPSKGTISCATVAVREGLTIDGHRNTGCKAVCPKIP